MRALEQRHSRQTVCILLCVAQTQLGLVVFPTQIIMKLGARADAIVGSISHLRLSARSSPISARSLPINSLIGSLHSHLSCFAYGFAYGFFLLLLLSLIFFLQHTKN